MYNKKKKKNEVYMDYIHLPNSETKNEKMKAMKS